MKRRRFLEFSGVAGAMMGIHPFMPQVFRGKGSRKTNLPEHLFVHIQIEGGADMLQSLDPYFLAPGLNNQDLWRGYLDSDIIRPAGTNIFLGPAAHALIPHADAFSVINGLWMTNGISDSHEQCRSYCASGQVVAISNTTLMAAEAAYHLGTGSYGVITNTTQEWRNFTRALVSVTTTDQLNVLAEDEFRPLIADLQALFGGTDFDSSLMEFSQSVALVSQFLKLKDQYLIDHALVDLDPYQIIALALASGLCRQGHINLGGDFTGPGLPLDTHGGSGYEKHLINQKWHWEKVSEIFNLFKAIPFGNDGSRLFDKTTFIVTNEFSRPPHLDEGDGKGHNPWNNSVLLAGKNVAGGKTIGSSFHMTSKETGKSPLLWGSPFDYSQGKSLTKQEMGGLSNLAGYELLRPENVAATVADILEIDAFNFKTIAENTKRIINLKK